MCQMPNIWHIYHTKYKNDALWDMLNLKNYTTCLQYRCKFATVRTNVVKNLLFYILFSLSSLFIFSFLFSLTLRFPLSSPCTGSFFLRRWSFRDRHVSRTKLRCRFRLSLSISFAKHGNDKRLDSASEAEDHRRNWTLRVSASQAEGVRRPNPPRAME